MTWNGVCVLLFLPGLLTARGREQIDDCAVKSYSYPGWGGLSYYPSQLEICSESDFRDSMLFANCTASGLSDGHSVRSMGFYLDTVDKNNELLKPLELGQFTCLFWEDETVNTCFIRSLLPEPKEKIGLKIRCFVMVRDVSEYVDKTIFNRNGDNPLVTAPIAKVWRNIWKDPRVKKPVPSLQIIHNGTILVNRTIEYSAGEDLTVSCAVDNPTVGPRYYVAWFLDIENRSYVLKTEPVYRTVSDRFEVEYSGIFAALHNSSRLICSYYELGDGVTIQYVEPITVKLIAQANVTARWDESALSWRRAGVWGGAAGAALVLAGAAAAVCCWLGAGRKRRKNIAYASTTTLLASNEAVYSLPLPKNQRHRQDVTETEVVYANQEHEDTGHACAGAGHASVYYSAAENATYVNWPHALTPPS